MEPGMLIALTNNWTPSGEVSVKPGDVCYPVYPQERPDQRFRYLGWWKFENLMDRRRWWQKLLGVPRNGHRFYEDPSHYRKVV
jgi:hypothetical protein